MKTILCTNSTKKAVTFFRNGEKSYIALAEQLGEDNRFEYWFTIGSTGSFSTLAGAKRAAVRELSRLGYTLNETALKNFTELNK